MRVFLTGATGFIGSHVTAELIAQGHTVRCLVRGGDRDRLSMALPPTLTPTERLRVEMVAGDVAMPNGIPEDACAECDAVIHLVGIIREFPRRGVTFHAVHTMGTESMIAAAQRAGVMRFLHMSALGTRPGAVANYHRTKWRAEESVQASGLDWTIFRPSLVIGRGGEFLEGLLVRMVRPRIAPALGGGRARFHPIAAGDLARGIVNALTRPETIGQTYEIGGLDVLTLAELLRMTAHARGHGVALIPVPMAPLRWAATLFDRFALFPVTRDQLTMMQEGSVCEDPERFLTQCGVAPRTIANLFAELLGKG